MIGHHSRYIIKLVTDTNDSVYWFAKYRDLFTVNNSISANDTVAKMRYLTRTLEQNTRGQMHIRRF